MSKDGGPAYPLNASISGVPVNKTAGMSLRDYFAGQALAGWFATQWPKGDDDERSEVAEICYEMADAMLEARNA